MGEEQLAGVMVAGHRLTPEVSASLQEASASTGVDFDFLVAQATVESGLKNVQARHSSAAGLFQFTTQTWLRMIRAHGAQYGLGGLAQKITTLANGHLAVSDRASEQKILDLRQDVKLSAIMAGELARENGHALEKALHRKANPAELHLAHLLGATGAIRVLRARAADPTQSAAALTPQAAKQNPQLFYARGNHTPVTVAGLYGKIKTRIETPLKQLAAAQRTDGLRPGPGLSDDLPKRRV
ncbi:MAG TPA: hypothetical protein VLX85_10730 [Stellaceae bacterium]|nr:hypothetical protein [Stellaceae bacterium]